ncbi:Disulfide-bond oxidoreductase YfcG [Jannaschia seosinensis]|uniref:Disulfide-bond oxidoreductase YfcG n=1 Tax=Jannaschia seosinensis TaxID=313367 RepID=A0A0M7B6T8_9RHOB|nr:glutathione S-transferase [Jannaschia seosinensis]CUH26854.1 Disulfide-bond oxidoreductase YfcG [Jannaschia seosinensis]
MTLKLHCFGESGNAYKAALTLELGGLDWTPVFVDFFHGATRTPEFRAINPMGEVPALETPEGVLTQSAVIQDWVAQQSGRFGFHDNDERREILRWQMFDNHKVSGVAGPLRFNMNFLPPEKRSEGANVFLAMRLRAALKVLDAHLEEAEWLALGRPTIADLGMCGYLFYPEPFAFERVQYPAIDAWLGRISALPGWKHPYDLMPGNPSDRQQGGPQ